jgi:hypothetical protein
VERERGREQKNKEARVCFEVWKSFFFILFYFNLIFSLKVKVKKKKVKT